MLDRIKAKLSHIKIDIMVLGLGTTGTLTIKYSYTKGLSSCSLLGCPTCLNKKVG